MIKSLNIERFKGFSNSGPKVKNLEKGMNIIYGENGAGKTTICKAIKALLWPQHFKDLSAKASSVWSGKNNEEIFCNLQDGATTFTTQNMSKDTTISIPEEFSSCFVISTDTFELSNDNTDKSISDLISKELSGGINFQNLRNSKELEFKPRTLRKFKNELNDVIKKRREIESEISELKSERASLPAIREKIAREQKLKKQSEVISNLIRKEELKKIISDYNDEIKNLNQGALSMKDDDIESIEKFEKRIKELSLDIDQKRDELAKLKLSKEDLEKEKILKKEDFEDFEIIKLELEKVEKSLDTIREYEKNIKAKKDEIVRALSSQEIYYKIRSYNKHRIEKLGLFLQDYKTLNDKKNDLKRALDLISINNDDSLNKLRKEYTVIENLNNLNSRAGISLICLIAFTLLTVLSFLYYPNTKIITCVFSVISFCAYIFLEYKCYQKRQEFDNKEYNINLKSKNAVKSLLEELKEKRNISLQRKFDKDKYYSIQQKISEVDEEISKLKASNTAYFDSSFEAIINVDSIINVWSAIKINDDELAALREESKQVLSKQSALIEKIKVYFNDDFENDLTFINRKLSKERNKREEYNLLLTKIEYLEKEINALSNNSLAYENDINDIYSRIGITKDNKNFIYSIFEDRKTYTKLKSELAIFDHELKTIDSKLVNNHDFENYSPKDLQVKQEEINEELKDLEGIDKKEVEILTRIDTFNKGNTYLSVKQEETEKKEALEDCTDKSLVSIAGSYILDFVENEYKREKEPEILVEANKLFSLFTNGKYSLKFKDDNEFSFFAFDEENLKVLTLKELSTGTKAQLILALRCSYVLSFSKDKEIPLLIDEVLATTDDIRFDAIMSSFFKLAKEGYQIIYFTSQKNVVGQIKNLANKQNVNITLRSISYLDKDLSNIHYEETKIKEIPNLKNVETKERLRLLNIAPITLPININSLPIAYLENDGYVLEKLLNLGVSSYGQLKNIYDKIQDKDFLLSKDVMNRIDAKVKALEIYSNLWSIGRGCKFSEDLINDNSTDTFKARLYEVADSTNWMSSDFLNAVSPNGTVKIARFKQQYDKLKDVFERESLIDDRKVLSEEELRSEFIAKCLNANLNLDKNRILQMTENIIREFN